MLGPNDHHFAKDEVTGVLVQKPGLGPLQPSDDDMRSAAERTKDFKLREEALATASSEIRKEALAMEQRQAAMDAKEAELNRRLAELDALTSGESEAPAGKRRALATERA